MFPLQNFKEETIHTVESLEINIGHMVMCALNTDVNFQQLHFLHKFIFKLFLV